MKRFCVELMVIGMVAVESGRAVTTGPPGAQVEFLAPELLEPTPDAQPLFFNPTGSIWESAAKAVAQLVSSNFPVPPPRQASPDFMGNILRILGLDKSKLGAIALNALILLAHVIGSTLMGRSSLKPGEEDDIGPPGNPLTWTFINSPNEARELVVAAQEKGLPERLIELLKDGVGGETDCIQLLLCKSAPVVWSMQRSLTKPPNPAWPSLTPLQRMFTYFPTLEEIAQHSATCNLRFPSCKLKHAHLDLD